MGSRGGLSSATHPTGPPPGGGDRTSTTAAWTAHHRTRHRCRTTTSNPELRNLLTILNRPGAIGIIGTLSLGPEDRTGLRLAVSDHARDDEFTEALRQLQEIDIIVEVEHTSRPAYMLTKSGHDLLEPLALLAAVGREVREQGDPDVPTG